MNAKTSIRIGSVNSRKERGVWLGFVVAASLFGLVAAAGCGNIDGSGGSSDPGGALRIVGGSPENNYPAVGALVVNGEAFCSGTLVSPTAVVTAAHCVAEDPNQSGVSFFIGNDVNNPGAGTMIPVSGMYPHPRFAWNTLENDVAVVRLSSSASVSPIALNREPMGQDSDRKDIEAILARNFDLAQSAVRLVSWSRLH